MEKEKQKLGVFPYIIGGLAYIPLIGVPFGIIAIIWGFVTKKIGGKILAFVGAGGIALTGLLYSGIYYFGFIQRSGVYDELRIELAKSTITSLVQAVEFYKTQNGTYPASLELLHKSLPEGSMVFVFDPTDVGMNSESRYFYYRLVDDDHYYLLGVGADGVPFTSDDIHPNVEVGPNSKVGLLIRRQ